MTNTLMHRFTTSPDRLPRDLERRVDQARGRGIEAAARVHAAAFVTQTAMWHTASLSAEEARLIEMCPLAEGRLKAVVDHFAGVACAEIAGMAF
ncbi:MAG TPA: hypothetical protein VFA63_12560 [Pseudonocardiaceae bacterium]|nr:hypothetical protein [Pseudonocardiaceae bacterium]